MALTKKQKNVLDYIENYINDFGYAPTQKEIKESFGLKSFGSVQRYIKYLVDSGYLENDENARRGLCVVANSLSQNRNGGISVPVSQDSQREIPLLGKVAAGNPIEAIEHCEQNISVPEHMIKNNQKYFALTVCGDSMIEDGILEDDIIICQKQNTANQGQTVIALIDGEATVKNFYKTKEGLELRPANSHLSPILIKKNKHDFKLIGVLVGLLRSYV